MGVQRLEHFIRTRRLRSCDGIRRMVAETVITQDDLVYPMFVTTESESREIASMPGIFRYTIDDLSVAIDKALPLGLRSIMLFGIPESKDPQGTSGYDPNGIVPTAIRSLKARFGAELVIIADVCLCEYTSHGHCGIVEGNTVLNDPTLELLAKSSLAYTEAGADIVAPSDMMDGRVLAIRKALDCAGWTQTPIMAYSAKYASGFYGPFREAAGSTPLFGDRRGYQMDPNNVREAMREIAIDIEEGADIVMVKPGLAYLDVLREARRNFLHPMAVYNVSGEYSMVKAAAQNGWIDERRVVGEILTAFKRAGADIILTYHTLDYLQWIK